MKKLLLILLMFISIGVYAQTDTTKNELVFSSEQLFKLGSYKLDDSVLINLDESIQELILNTPESDSLVIKAVVETSTDNKKIHKNLKEKLIKQNYVGSNKGLSQIRNDKVSKIVLDVLNRNKVRNYFDKVKQIVNFESGDTDENRYMKVKFTIVPIRDVDKQLITLQALPTPQIDCDSIFLQRELRKEAIIDSLRDTKGCRVYMKRKEYKGFRKYTVDKYSEEDEKVFVNEVYPDIRYLVDYEDVAKLNQNTSNFFRKKFTRKLTKGALFITGGVVCFWQGALIHPIYRHKYEYTDGIKFRVPDSELSPEELAYYKAINHKADREMRQRKTWYIIGGVASAIGAVFVWDAFEYRKLSLQVGSPNGIIGLKYDF